MANALTVKGMQSCVNMMPQPKHSQYTPYGVSHVRKGFTTPGPVSTGPQTSSGIRGTVRAFVSRSIGRPATACTPVRRASAERPKSASKTACALKTVHQILSFAGRFLLGLLTRSKPQVSQWRGTIPLIESSQHMFLLNILKN